MIRDAAVDQPAHHAADNDSAAGVVTQPAIYSAQRAGFGSVGGALPPASGSRTASQNWVTVREMQGTFSAVFDATGWDTHANEGAAHITALSA